MFRRYLAEFVGTFVIVLAPVALTASVAHANGDHSLLNAALVSGLSVLAMIYTFGPISAAHFNPAVTLGFAVAKRFPWRFVPAYWIAQFSGGVAAAAFSFLLFGQRAGAHIPADPSALGRNIAVEAMVTFFLMLVVIAVATDRRVSSTAPPIAVGFIVIVGVLIGGPVTGGSMNPARSFGPSLFVQDALRTYWLYFVGPCLGAIIAALLYEQLRLEPDHAKGAPNEVLEALISIDTAEIS